MNKMMKKVSLVMATCLVIGVAVVSTASASYANNTQNMWTEGMDYAGTGENPPVTTTIAKQNCTQDMYTEGPNYGCGPEGKMVPSTPGTLAVTDSWTEGPEQSDSLQITVAKLKQAALKAKPAAGK